MQEGGRVKRVWRACWSVGTESGRKEIPCKVLNHNRISESFAQYELYSIGCIWRLYALDINDLSGFIDGLLLGDQIERIL